MVTIIYLYQSKLQRPQTTKARPQSSISVLTVEDFERIRKNAKISTQEEESNNHCILKEQKDCQRAKANAHKDRLAYIDKTQPIKGPISDIERENIEKSNSIIAGAKKAQEKDEDPVKEMNQMLNYAKVVTIRDIQVEEHKKMEEEYKKKEEKVDLMMEYERLKELKFQEEQEHQRKAQRREGALIIVDQIKERDLQKLKRKEEIQKEHMMIVKQIKELEEEDKRIVEQKRIEAEKLAKEVERTNKISALNREKKKLDEKIGRAHV